MRKRKRGNKRKFCSLRAISYGYEDKSLIFDSAHPWVICREEFVMGDIDGRLPFRTTHVWEYGEYHNYINQDRLIFTFEDMMKRYLDDISRKKYSMGLKNISNSNKIFKLKDNN